MRYSKLCSGVAHVYFIWAMGTGKVKIGKSVNVGKRMKVLSKVSSHWLVLLCTLREQSGISKQGVHQALRHLKDAGGNEWYFLGDDLVALIEMIIDGVSITKIKLWLVERQQI